MYKVIKNFTDKYTKARYKVGEEIDFTEKRAKEIISFGNLIEKIEEKTEEVEKVETKKKSTKKK